MIKSILILINLSAIMLFSIFNIDDISITHKGNSTLVIGDTTEVKIIINKMDFSGPGRLKLNLSEAEGITIIEKESDGASFTFNNNEGLFIWYDLPNSKNIEITYLVTTNSLLKGMQKITGTFSFINENQRKQIKVPMYIFEVSKEQNLASIPPSVKSIRSIEKIEDYYVVKIHTTKGKHKGFARIKDKLPQNYIAEAVETDGAVFKNIDGYAKFIWSDLPEELESFTVTYKIKHIDNIDTSFSITGEYASENLIKEGYKSGIEIPISHYLKDSEEFTYNKLENDTTKLIVNEENNQQEITIEETTPTENDSIIQTPIETIEITEDSVENTNEEIIISEEETKPLETEEERILVNNTHNNDKVNNQINYKVQILAAHRIAGKEYFSRSFKFNENFDLENHEGWVKYTTGSFDKYKSARDKRNNLSTHKFPGPFVTAYNNGERITVQEALIVSKQSWIQ